MTDTRWMIVVIGLFVAGTLIFWRRARKDMFGAIGIGIVVILLCWLLISVSGCTVREARAPWIEAGIAYDVEHTVGRNPACILRVRQPVGPEGREDRVIVSVEHHSSCPDQDDRAEINQLEVVAKIPLGRHR